MYNSDIVELAVQSNKQMYQEIYVNQKHIFYSR